MGVGYLEYFCGFGSMATLVYFFFFFSSRRRHTRCSRDWSSDVCSSDLGRRPVGLRPPEQVPRPVQPRLRLAATDCLPQLSRRRAGRSERQRLGDGALRRSEERRVGKEWRSRRWGEQSQEESSLTRIIVM